MHSFGDQNSLGWEAEGTLPSPNRTLIYLVKNMNSGGLESRYPIPAVPVIANMFAWEDRGIAMQGIATSCNECHESADEPLCNLSRAT